MTEFRAAEPSSTSAEPTAAARSASGARPRLVDLSNLPPTLDLTTAARLLGIGRSTAYALIRDDRFPCPTFKAGHQHRVATAVLLRLLGIATPEPEQPEAPFHSE